MKKEIKFYFEVTKMGYPIKIGKTKYVVIKQQQGSGKWSQDILLTEAEYQRAVKRQKQKRW